MQLIYSVNELTANLGDELQGRATKPELEITSMPQLNRKIWGIRRGKLTIFAARTSHGKTSFAMQVSKDLAMAGHKVLFLSLEMSNKDMAERLFCNMKEVSNEDLQQGKFKDHREKYLEWSKEISRMNLAFSDCLGRTWVDIDNTISKMRQEFKPDVVVLDYIQAIKGMGTMERGMIEEYIKKFREMAVKHNYAGIMLSQINRSSESGKEKRPQLHQLKGTGFLEEHADVVILLHWPYKSDPEMRKEEHNKYFLEIAKNRNGRTGHTMLFYHPQFYLFCDPRKNSKEQVEGLSDDHKNVMDMFDGTLVGRQE